MATQLEQRKEAVQKELEALTASAEKASQLRADFSKTSVYASQPALFDAAFDTVANGLLKQMAELQARADALRGQS